MSVYCFQLFSFLYRPPVFGSVHETVFTLYKKNALMAASLNYRGMTVELPVLRRGLPNAMGTPANSSLLSHCPG